jgi:hypothetical protein
MREGHALRPPISLDRRQEEAITSRANVEIVGLYLIEGPERGRLNHTSRPAVRTNLTLPIIPISVPGLHRSRPIATALGAPNGHLTQNAPRCPRCARTTGRGRKSLALPAAYGKMVAFWEVALMP